MKLCGQLTQLLSHGCQLHTVGVVDGGQLVLQLSRDKKRNECDVQRTVSSLKLSCCESQLTEASYCFAAEQG